MKKEFYTADIGSVAVMCGESIICFRNGYGDGFSKVYRFEDRNEFSEYQNEHLEKYDIPLDDYKFNTTAIFVNAKVLNYDCLKPQEVTNKHVLFELNGRYGIYYNYGKVYFVKWYELDEEE